MDNTVPEAVACPGCGATMRHDITQMPMWLGAELKLISGVPAYVCDDCDRQEFDASTEAAIRRLVAQGFPDHRIRDRVVVPVFALEDFAEDATRPDTIRIPEAAR